MDIVTASGVRADEIVRLFETTFTASEGAGEGRLIGTLAPLPLTQPHGWQAQSLTDAPLTPFAGPAACVPAFDDPALW